LLSAYKFQYNAIVIVCQYTNLYYLYAIVIPFDTNNLPEIRQVVDLARQERMFYSAVLWTAAAVEAPGTNSTSRDLRWAAPCPSIS